MIISASRRTDIPAYHGEWLINRLRAGCCLVSNPFNPRQVSRVDLRPESVDALVFWTRNARPLLPRLPELDRAGYAYAFLYTIVAHGSALDGKTPSPERAARTFRELAELLGPERLIWRYDPIVLTERTDCGFHLRAFEDIARRLQGATKRVIVSFYEPYKKTRRRMDALADQGYGLIAPLEEDLLSLLATLPACAEHYGMRVQGCAQEMDLQPYGIVKGSCIDPEWLSAALGRNIEAGRDPRQRSQCGCAISKDIGAYDSCLTGCGYCYASSDFQRAARNAAQRDPLGESLSLSASAPEQSL
jgi:hypothetical protein